MALVFFSPTTHVLCSCGACQNVYVMDKVLCYVCFFLFVYYCHIFANVFASQLGFDVCGFFCLNTVRLMYSLKLLWQILFRINLFIMNAIGKLDRTVFRLFYDYVTSVMNICVDCGFISNEKCQFRYFTLNSLHKKLTLT